METQKELEWISKELETQQPTLDFEKNPSLKLEENKVVSLVVDFSKPFEKWSGEQEGKSVTKKIIPVSNDKGEKLVWWLNVRNPIYRQLLELGQKGQSNISVLKTGKGSDIKYVLVK